MLQSGERDPSPRSSESLGLSFPSAKDVLGTQSTVSCPVSEVGVILFPSTMARARDNRLSRAHEKATP